MSNIVDISIYTFECIPGIDYVSHDDILPYTVTENAKPIQHELFDKFLTKEDLPDKSKCVSWVEDNFSKQQWNLSY